MSLLRSPRVWFLLLVLSVTAVMCLAYVAWQVGNVLSKPQRRTSIAPPDWPVTVLSLSTDTGGVVKGWLAVGAPGQGAVLLLHGVHADRLSMLERAPEAAWMYGPTLWWWEGETPRTWTETMRRFAGRAHPAR